MRRGDTQAKDHSLTLAARSGETSDVEAKHHSLTLAAHSDEGPDIEAKHHSLTLAAHSGERPDIGAEDHSLTLAARSGATPDIEAKHHSLTLAARSGETPDVGAKDHSLTLAARSGATPDIEAKHHSLTLAARSSDAAAGRWLRDAFARAGIDPARIEFAGRQSRGAYFAWIASADIALDPFPYNGGVTTCDTLWMGVPVVSLAGNAYWSRQGLALLSNVGLAELAVASIEKYVEVATALAHDLPRLAGLRRGLREKMRQSAIVDAAGFAGKLEAAYRAMWQGRCAGVQGRAELPASP